MEMAFKIIPWITTVIFAVCFIICIVKGLLRGFRKSLILFLLTLLALIISYAIYLLVLRKSFFDKLIIDSFWDQIKNATGISDKPSRLSEVLSLMIKKNMSEEVQVNYSYFENVVEALVNSILGLLYMVLTFFAWILTYILLYFVVYLPFFREGKYKKKLKKKCENESDIEDISDENADEDNKKNKVYKKRRLLGGLVGSVKGILMGIIFTSFFVTLFYIYSNNKTYKFEDGEEIVVQLDDKEYNLTDIFDFLYEYDRTGVNFALNRMVIDGQPIGAYIPSLFCNGKIVIKEDNIKTKIYPIKELANIFGILEEGTVLLNDYGIIVGTSDEKTLTQLKILITTNDEFVNALYEFITSIPSKTPLFKTLGKIISIHFYDMLVNAGYSNKYLDCIFRGDHAITISDIVNKSDIKVCLNIVSKGINTYDDYKDTKDIKEIFINQTQIVKSIVNEILNLYVFENDSDTVNGLVGDLLEIVCENVNTLKGISFDGIKFVGKSNILSEFTNTVFKFLNISLIEYSDKNIVFNYKNINSIFNSENGETSVIDDIKSSEILRRISSCVLENSDVGSGKLYIPSSCKDEMGYIKSSEFVQFFTSIQQVIESSTFSKDQIYLNDLAEDIVPEIINTISNNKNMPSYVSSSNVLTSIASNYIYDSIKDTVTIPEELVLTDEVREQNIDTWLGNDGELYHLLNAAITYGVGDIIANGAEININDFLDSSKMETALNSKIIYYTVSKEILEVSETSEEIMIPSIAKDGDLLKKEEIVNAIGAIEELEKDLETKDIDSLNQNVILTKDLDIDTILKSNIIWYSVSDSFANCGVNIPNVSYVDKDASEKYISKDEIKNTITALKKLGQDNLDAIEINSTVFLTLYADDAKMDLILDSYTARYEISSRFIEKIGDDVPVDVKEVIEDQNFITKDEIKSVTKALNEFGIIELNNYTMNQQKLLQTSNYDNILSSHIIWFKATKEIINSGQFIILDSATDTTIGSDVYLKYNEVKNLLMVSNKLGLESLGMSSLDISKIKSNNLETTIGDTITLRATLTDIVLYQNQNGIIYDIDHITSGNSLYNSSDVRYVYTSTETVNIINGLNALGITNYNDSLTYTKENVKALDQNSQEILLSSNTLYLYTSKLFDDISGSIGDEYYTTYDVLEKETDIVKISKKVLIKNKLLAVLNN